jgi:hypothetical protein
MDMRNLTKAYFDQGTQYYSESKDTLIDISEMPTVYAANAARRLLTDSAIWMQEANAGMGGSNAARWMLRTKLFNALMTQAKGN